MMLWLWGTLSGLEIKIFSREPNCIFKSHLQVLCIETNIFLGSLQKFEGAAGGFNEALGSQHPLISSPGCVFGMTGSMAYDFQILWGYYLKPIDVSIGLYLGVLT